MSVLRHLHYRLSSLVPRNRLASGAGLLALSASSTLGGALLLASAGAASASVTAPAAQGHPAYTVRTAAPVSTHTAAVSPFETVAPGDTLSSISLARCGTAADWSGIFYANRPPLRDPDVIAAGQVLRISCTDPGYAYPKPPAPHVQRQAQQPVQTGSAPAPAAQTYTGSDAMQRCIIRAESGGNPQSVNPASGAGGLYQFLPSTWRALGHSGLPENASVAEQNQAFAQEVAQDGGYTAWTPYDAC